MTPVKYKTNEFSPAISCGGEAEVPHIKCFGKEVEDTQRLECFWQDVIIKINVFFNNSGELNQPSR